MKTDRIVHHNGRVYRVVKTEGTVTVYVHIRHEPHLWPHRPHWRRILHEGPTGLKVLEKAA